VGLGIEDRRHALTPAGPLPCRICSRRSSWAAVTQSCRRARLSHRSLVCENLAFRQANGRHLHGSRRRVLAERRQELLVPCRPFWTRFRGEGVGSRCRCFAGSDRGFEIPAGGDLGAGAPFGSRQPSRRCCLMSQQRGYAFTTYYHVSEFEQSQSQLEKGSPTRTRDHWRPRPYERFHPDDGTPPGRTRRTPTHSRCINQGAS
jgi:hypothetical protein